MRGPVRKSEQFRKYQDGGGLVHITRAGQEQLERKLRDLERELPQTIAEVGRTKEFGDLSENAAYQDAKARLRRIHSQIFSLQDKLKRAQVIKQSASGFIELGATVVLEVGGLRKTFEIVGPQETSPSRGRISHVSPLGKILIGHVTNDTVTLSVNGKNTTYKIIAVRS